MNLTQLKIAALLVPLAVAKVALKVAQEAAITVATVAFAGLMGLAVAWAASLCGLTFPVSLPAVGGLLAFLVRIYEGAKS